jgi:competence protein ComEC
VIASPAMRVLLVCASLLTATFVVSGRDLKVYFVDVEGGQATLVVSPSSESLLIDAGYAGFNNRDADRIAEVARDAGVRKIDYLGVTHYHADHAGGVPQLAEKLPIVNFLDHGPTVEDSQRGRNLYRAYQEVASKGRRIQVKPGDSIPLESLQVRVVAAGGAVLASPLPGMGERNPECTNLRRDYSGSENAQSIGLLIVYGDFRLLDLGDLGGDNERQLVCPVNKVGSITVLVASHHGNDDASSPSVVHTLRPRVAIVGNGALKGGAPRTFETIRKTPGVEDVWQLHYSWIEPRSQNSPLPFIANPEQRCKGRWLKLTAQADGSFRVYNAGNRFEKIYRPK